MIVVAGLTNLEDASAVGCTVIDATMTESGIADTNWDELTTEHSVVDSYGQAVNDILIDTSTTIPSVITTSETRIRGSDDDTLKTISDQLDNVNVEGFILAPERYYIPVEDGTYSIYIRLFLYDSSGQLAVADTNPVINIYDISESTVETGSMLIQADGGYDYTWSISKTDMAGGYFTISTLSTVGGYTQHISKLIHFIDRNESTETMIANNVMLQRLVARMEYFNITVTTFENDKIKAGIITSFTDDTKTVKVAEYEFENDYNIEEGTEAHEFTRIL